MQFTNRRHNILLEHKGTIIKAGIAQSYASQSLKIYLKRDYGAFCRECWDNKKILKKRNIVRIRKLTVDIYGQQNKGKLACLILDDIREFLWLLRIKTNTKIKFIFK